MLPTAAAFEHPERVGRRRRARTSRSSASRSGRCRCSTGATRRTPTIAEAVARREVRLLRRRLADAPALGAQGLGALRGAARRVPQRRGRRRVRRRRHGAVRPDGRPARRCVHRGPRVRGGPRGLPVPRHRGRPPPARARSTCNPPEAVLVGVDEETALVREPGPAWSVAGEGAVTIYGADGPTRYAAGAEGIDLP